jgi:Capsule assembly protein Wzi
VGVQLGNFDVTVGKQSLWWGPGQSSAFHFSDNAEPLYALRLAQARPILLPGPLRVLGRIRTQFLLGELSGHQYPPRPFINAQKITLQVTEDLELGFTRSAIFGGVGHPLTAQSFFQSFFNASSSRRNLSDPGDRRSGFDFRWRVPKPRRYVTIYSDSLADDEPNPLANPRRSAWAPGIYITHLPKLRNLDLRFETYSTWLYRKDEGGGFFYWNSNYHDAYTNNGNLLGSWVGRDARAYVASSTYWWSGSNKVTASFRQTKTGSKFLPGGGTQTDASLTVQWQLRPGLLATAFGQYERYFVPVLGSPRRDVAAGLQFVYYPRNWAIHK